MWLPGDLVCWEKHPMQRSSKQTGADGGGGRGSRSGEGEKTNPKKIR